MASTVLLDTKEALRCFAALQTRLTEKAAGFNVPGIVPYVAQSPRPSPSRQRLEENAASARLRAERELRDREAAERQRQQEAERVRQEQLREQEAQRERQERERRQREAEEARHAMEDKENRSKRVHDAPERRSSKKQKPVVPPSPKAHHGDMGPPAALRPVNALGNLTNVAVPSPLQPKTPKTADAPSPKAQAPAAAVKAQAPLPTPPAQAAAPAEPRKGEPPAWSRPEALHHALLMQSVVDPDTIFAPLTSCELSAIFGTNWTKRRRPRTSSANWHLDRFTAEEERRYKRHMGYAT